MAYNQKKRGVSTPDNRRGVRRDNRAPRQAANDNRRMWPKRIIRPSVQGPTRLFDGPNRRAVFGSKALPQAAKTLRGFKPANLGLMYPGLMFAASQWESVYNAAEAIKHYQSGGHISGASGWYRENGPYKATDYPVTIAGVTTYPYREGPFWSITAWPAGKLAGQAITPNINTAPGGSVNNNKAGLWLRGKIGVSTRYALAESWARNVAEPEGKPFYTAQIAGNIAQVNDAYWLVNVLPHAFHVGNLMASPYPPPMWMAPHRVNHPAIDPYIGYQAGYSVAPNVKPYSQAATAYSPYKDVEYGFSPKTSVAIGRNPHANRPPRRNEKERKATSKVVGMMWGAMGAGTEALDTLDAAHDALPKSIKNPKPPKYLWGDKEGTAQWRRQQNTPQAKAERLWRNYNDVDLNKFAWNMVRNNVNDAMWGKMGFKGGPWTGPGWEARVNGAGVRNYETQGAMDDLGIQGTKFPLDPGKYVADIVIGPQSRGQ